MPTTYLTDLGLSKIAQASGDETAVGIAHVALGDANGSHYTPNGTEAALRRERHRKAIDYRQFLGDRTWRVKAEFGTDTPTMDVREAGFFDQDGDLIVICTFAANEERKTGAVTYLIDEVLNFSFVQRGLIYVDAPDDELFDHAVLNLETHAIVAAEQFAQRLMIRDLQAAT